jgi:hypothetical protein
MAAAWLAVAQQWEVGEPANYRVDIGQKSLKSSAREHHLFCLYQ